MLSTPFLPRGFILYITKGISQFAHCASLYLVADLPAMIYKEQRDLIPSDSVISTILP